MTGPLYQKNLNALRLRSPQLAQWVDTSPAGSDENACPPEGDSEALAARQAREAGVECANTSILFGLGLGRLPREILHQAPADHQVLVIENNPAVIRDAFAAVDLSQALAGQRLVLLRSCRDIQDQAMYDTAVQMRRGRLKILENEAGRNYFSPAFREEMDRFCSAARLTVRRQCVLIEHAHQATENEIVNLPRTLMSPDAGRLEGVLAGRPAVVVSAGPSLTAALPFLALCPGRAAVIATAPTARILAACDVRPDLIGVMDYTEENYAVLRDAYDLEDSPLVFMESTYAPLVEKFHGPWVSALHEKSQVRRWLGGRLGDRASWDAGDHVGGFCVLLAIHMGADPVIMIGQDLAFPDRQVHAEGVAGRTTVEDQSQIQDARLVESVYGGRVVTSLSFNSYLESLTALIAEYPDRTFINTSHAGARIPGALEMPLDQALKRHCREEYDPAGRILRSLTPPPPPPADILDDLAVLVDELNQVRVVTDKILEFDREISDLLGQNRPDRERLVHLIRVHGEYARTAERYFKAFPPLHRFLSSPLALYWHEDGNGPGGGGLNALRAELDKSRGLMEAAGPAIDRLAELIRTSRFQLAVWMEHPSDVRDLAPDDLARAWTRIGRLDAAWSWYRTALADRPDDPDLLAEAARVCLERGRLRTAEQLAGLVLDRRPGHEGAEAIERDIRETLADWARRGEAAVGSGDWVTAVLVGRELVNHDPDNKRGQWMIDQGFGRRDRRLTEAVAEARSAVAEGRLAEIRRQAEKTADHDPEGAARLLEREGRRDKSRAPLLMDAARTRSQLNQIPQALRAVMAFLLTDPGHLDGLTLAGQCHLEQGRPDSARRYFEKALAQDPDHRPAAQGLARCRPAAASVSPAKAAGP